MKLPKRLVGLLFLLLSNIFVSAASPTIAKLIEIGNNHLINGRNPISFCNVLFASSFAALLTLTLLYFKELKSFNPNQLSRSHWITVVLSAVIAGFLVPMLYFFGIKYSNIINVVLISTLQTPLYILAGWLFFKQPPSPTVLIAGMFTMIGVVLIVLLPSEMTTSQMTSPKPLGNPFLSSIPHIGDIFIFLAVLLTTISSILMYQTIKTISGSLFNILSTALGTVFFASIVIVLFGPSHFNDLFSPFLWRWMLFYGGVIIALRGYFKFIGLKNANMADIAISNSLTPLASIVLSFFILGVLPQSAQLIGGALIFIGLGTALYGKLSENENPVSISPKQGATGF
ncbi:DMT family transporter [Legionella sp. W05-934-2]|uniref:DMT family transporter n=1 Tax=Legionella sp. W05-934-2 TaxID=1198649 RepID=UPI0034621577